MARVLCRYVIHGTRGCHACVQALDVDVGVVKLNGSLFLFFTGKISVYLQKEVFFIRLGENNFTSHVSTLRTLHCALVRSQLEFGSVVWPPFTDRNITKLERVQRRATEFILKTEDDYELRISRLDSLYCL